MGGRAGSVLRSRTAFHLAAGARLAFRAAVPAVAVLVVGIGLSPAPAAAMQAAALALAGPPSLAGAAVVLAAALSLAFWVSRRAAVGATGWLVALPGSAADRRRALAAALVVGQAPLAVLLAASAAALVLAGVSGAAVPAARTAGAVEALAGAALAALPVTRRALSSACAATAAVLGAWGSPATVALGIPALIAGDLLAGPLQPRRAARPVLLPLPLPAAVALRALAGSLAGAWVAGALPLLAGAAFLRNNVLPHGVAQGAVRLAGVLAAGTVVPLLAAALAVHRPVWPWFRSLPMAARTRVLWDAAVLAAAACPAVVGAALLPGASLAGWGPVVLALPWLALRGADAVRRPPGREGALLGETALAAAWIALLPWLAWLGVALAPPALRWAVRRDRSLVAAAWEEKGRLLRGDSMTWSDG